jgi:hypothetical protein
MLVLFAVVAGCTRFSPVGGLWFDFLDFGFLTCFQYVLLRAAVIKVLRSSSAAPGRRLWILSSVLLVGVFFSVPLQIRLEMA